MKKPPIYAAVAALSILVTYTACRTKETASSSRSALNVDQDFDFPNGFVPDPGKDGRETLVGVDRDRDGTRDDLQRWIFARHPHDIRKRTMLVQYARVGQAMISNQAMAPKQYVERLGKAAACVSLAFGDSLSKGAFTGYAETELLDAKIYNTPVRVARFMAMDGALNGELLVAPAHVEAKDCE